MTDPTPPTPPEAPTPPAHGIPVDHAHQHPEAHEHSDVDVRALVIAIFAIAATAAVVHIALYFLLGLYAAQVDRSPVNEPRTAISAPAAGPPPEVPRLQGIQGFHPNSPREDMAALRERNRALLGTYGHAAEPGRVRIPIDRAIDLALERGVFPVRDAAGPTQEGAPDAQR